MTKVDYALLEAMLLAEVGRSWDRFRSLGGLSPEERTERLWGLIRAARYAYHHGEEQLPPEARWALARTALALGVVDEV